MAIVVTVLKYHMSSLASLHVFVDILIHPRFTSKSFTVDLRSFDHLDLQNENN